MIPEDLARLTARIETVEDQQQAMAARLDIHTRQISAALAQTGRLADRVFPVEPAAEEEHDSDRYYREQFTGEEAGPGFPRITDKPARITEGDISAGVSHPELILVITPPDDTAGGQVLVRVEGGRWWVDFRPAPHASWTPALFFPGSVEERQV